ncbi:hypothetical protein C8Q74DRAFT_1216041 [Fomes fomentarius]|nr:hypothetical protein C8Q74DRAFT_1216041 [Fomes fomentarius]
MFSTTAIAPWSVLTVLAVARTRPPKYDSHQRSTNEKQGTKTGSIKGTHAGMGYQHGLGASHAAGPRKIFDHPTKNGKQPKTKNTHAGMGYRHVPSACRIMRLARGVDRPRGSKTSTTKYESLQCSRTGNNERNTHYKAKATRAGMGESHVAALVNPSSRQAVVCSRSLYASHMFGRLDRFSTGSSSEADKQQRLPENEETNNVAIMSDTSERHLTNKICIQTLAGTVSTSPTTYLDLKDMTLDILNTGSEQNLPSWVWCDLREATVLTSILGLWMTSRDSDDMVLASHGLDDLPTNILGSSGY